MNGTENKLFNYFSELPFRVLPVIPLDKDTLSGITFFRSQGVSAINEKLPKIFAYSEILKSVKLQKAQCVTSHNVDQKAWTGINSVSDRRAFSAKKLVYSHFC